MNPLSSFDKSGAMIINHGPAPATAPVRLQVWYLPRSLSGSAHGSSPSLPQTAGKRAGGGTKRKDGPISPQSAASKLYYHRPSASAAAHLADRGLEVSHCARHTCFSFLEQGRGLLPHKDLYP